jgi:hypothetical protein
MRKILLFIVVLSAFGFYACKNNSSAKNGVVEIIKDANYINGIGLEGSNSSSTEITRVLYPFGQSKNNQIWKLAQWGSRFDLKDAKRVNGDNGITYSNPGKSIAFKAVDGSTQITMKIFGSKEYLAPRKFGEDWPHILLEQQFENPQSVSNVEALNFNLDFRLLFSEMKMSPDSFNPEIHTTQFTVYLTIQNKNQSSKAYGDFIWFGLPLYDYRYDEIAEYAAKDLGKGDASNKFIFSTASKNIYSGSAKDGNWIKISKDIIGIIHQAFITAQERGFLKESKYEDMYITTTNMGWETPGTFDCAIQYNNLKLTAIIKK